MFACTSNLIQAMDAEGLSQPASGEAKSPITGAIKDPITKFMLMRQEVLTHGPSHKE